MSVDGVTRFEGHRRPDGRLGVRNRVLVLPSVICSHLVAEKIANRAEGAVAAPHDHGCAQIGADNDQTRRTFLGIGTNPNVAGTLMVGLGCEAVQSDAVAAALADRGAVVEELSIQGAGGTEPAIEAGTAAVGELADRTAATTAASATLSDLTIGVVSSDLDDSTVECADPLVGELVRRVVDAGGRVLAAGNERFIGQPDAARSVVVPEASEVFETFLDRHRDHPPRATRVGYRAVRRGFEESTRFLGGRPVRELLRYGESATIEEGVALVDAPSRFGEAATGLAAAGAQLIVHVTAEGIPTGHPVAPVLKVTGDPTTVDALPNDIDIDATTASAADLTNQVCALANGERTCAEHHGLNTFALTRVGPSM